MQWVVMTHFVGGSHQSQEGPRTVNLVGRTTSITRHISDEIVAIRYYQMHNQVNDESADKRKEQDYIGPHQRVFGSVPESKRLNVNLFVATRAPSSRARLQCSISFGPIMNISRLPIRWDLINRF
jgi:hypothetical protein